MGNSKHPYNFKEIFETGKKKSTVLYQHWQQVILPSYGIRDLSKASDKLPAISGVTKAFRAKLNNGYLAGLWRKDLMLGLLWFNVSVFRTPLCRQNTAPQAGAGHRISSFRFSWAWTNWTLLQAFTWASNWRLGPPRQTKVSRKKLLSNQTSNARVLQPVIGAHIYPRIH